MRKHQFTAQTPDLDGCHFVFSVSFVYNIPCVLL